MMRALTCLALIAILAATSACGTRGKLKSPSQIAAAEAKKQSRINKKAGLDDLTLPQTEKTDDDSASELNEPKPAGQDQPHVDSGSGSK